MGSEYWAAKKVVTTLTQEAVCRVVLTLPCMVSCAHILTAVPIKLSKFTLGWHGVCR